MPPSRDESDLYDPHQFGPDLSRGFPGLRVWLSVKLFGAAPRLSRYLGRVCVLSFRTRRERIDECVRHLAEETRAVIGRAT